MILSAAGAVDHDPHRRGGRGDLRRAEAGRQSTPEPARWHGAERREQKDLEQVHFAMGFAGPGYRHPDLYTAQVYATAMGGGMVFASFPEDLREERGAVQF